MLQPSGGVTAPKGFRAAGVRAGIKKQGKDVAVIYSETPAVVAAVFTTSTVKAAPVLWSQRVLSQRDTARAVVVNSGNANACTGETGMEHAIQMCETTAHRLGLETDDILVASTGVIGVPLPIEKACAGIAAACAELAADQAASDAAVEAIMTTDTRPKQAVVQIEIDGSTVTIGGMAKGSGMIHPNMATMLAFVTTDAAIDAGTLQALLRETVYDSYNMISVDGDTSTNDTLMVLANGAAGNTLLTADHPAFPKFRQAFRDVNISLAKQIVGDGEGATKLIEVHVTGAVDETNARTLVKSILTSNLVKTAFFGEDANWGRILAAMGYSGATFGVAGVSIAFQSDGGRVLLMEDGDPEPFDEADAKRVLQAREISVDVTLSDGSASAVGWGCDLSYDYVRINGDYRT